MIELLLVFLLGVGIFAGRTGMDVEWQKDCDQVQAHRTGDVAYICKRKTE